MEDGFEILYTGHENRARKLILKNGIKTAEELAMMTGREVEQTINANFEAVKAGQDWILIPRDKLSDFNAMVTWIERS